MLAPYARIETTTIIIVGGGLTALCAYYAGAWAIAPGLLTLASLAFYRDPPRRIPSGGNILVSPADGKVTEVARRVDRAGEEAQLHIGIFLSVANVHINRSPCAGRVTDVNWGGMPRVYRLRSAARNGFEVLAAANALAALSCRALGGRAGLCGAEEVLAFIAAHGEAGAQ